ncbi:hypothetical protein HC891_26350 [Candidatus Gracilibacteria bacterium]|nr:hypothetical protein [Candidatus Gracilibacteria bacterium]
MGHSPAPVPACDRGGCAATAGPSRRCTTLVTSWLPQRQLTPAAIELLHAYTWPGNLGELRGVVMRAALLAGDGPIEAIHLPERIRTAPLPHSPVRLPPEGLSLEALEIDLIRQALARASGNKSRAAELLGLTRHTLIYRLEKYKLGEP